MAARSIFAFLVFYFFQSGIVMALMHFEVPEQLLMFLLLEEATTPTRLLLPLTQRSRSMITKKMAEARVQRN
jgi:hypothetical protein